MSRISDRAQVRTAVKWSVQIPNIGRGYHHGWTKNNYKWIASSTCNIMLNWICFSSYQSRSQLYSKVVTVCQTSCVLGLSLARKKVHRTSRSPWWALHLQNMLLIGKWRLWEQFVLQESFSTGATRWGFRCRMRPKRRHWPQADAYSPSQWNPMSRCKLIMPASLPNASVAASVSGNAGWQLRSWYCTTTCAAESARSLFKASGTSPDSVLDLHHVWRWWSGGLSVGSSGKKERGGANEEEKKRGERRSKGGQERRRRGKEEEGEWMNGGRPGSKKEGKEEDERKNTKNICPSQARKWLHEYKRVFAGGHYSKTWHRYIPVSPYVT